MKMKLFGLEPTVTAFYIKKNQAIRLNNYQLHFQQKIKYSIYLQPKRGFGLVSILKAFAFIILN